MVVEMTVVVAVEHVEAIAVTVTVEAVQAGQEPLSGLAGSVVNKKECHLLVIVRELGI